MGVVSTELLNIYLESFRLGVGNNKGVCHTLTGNHTEDRSMSLGGASLSLLSTLGFVLVSFPTAKLHLIQLHFAIKGDRVILCEEGTHLVEYEPRCLLTSIQVTG